MGDEAWSARRIGDFATRSKIINTDGTQLPPLSITKDRGVVLQSEKYKKQIATDLRKYVIARRGQFAFDPMSLYYGAIGRVASMEIGLVSPDYVVFDVDDTIDKTFLNYLLRSPRQVAEYEAVAETGNSFGKRRRVYWSVLEQMALHVPPLDEQRQIAAILSAVDEAIEATQAVIDHLQVVKKAMMAELLTRGLPGRHTRFKQTEVGELPETWQLAPVDRLLSTPDGLCYGVVQPGEHVADGVPLVRVNDVSNGRVDLSDLKRIARSISDSYQRSILRGGELLVTVVGTIGRCAVAPLEARGMNLARAVAKLDLGAHVRAAFVASVFESDYGQRSLAGETRESARKTLNLEQLRQIRVPLPSLDEQDEIMQVLDATRERFWAEEAKGAALRTLRTALTAQLLTAEVRVSRRSEAGT